MVAVAVGKVVVGDELLHALDKTIDIKSMMNSRAIFFLEDASVARGTNG
jgi:hypothetical protein